MIWGYNLPYTCLRVEGEIRGCFTICRSFALVVSCVQLIISSWALSRFMEHGDPGKNLLTPWCRVLPEQLTAHSRLLSRSLSLWSRGLNYAFGIALTLVGGYPVLASLRMLRGFVTRIWGWTTESGKESFPGLWEGCRLIKGPCKVAKKCAIE